MDIVEISDSDYGEEKEENHQKKKSAGRKYDAAWEDFTDVATNLLSTFSKQDMLPCKWCGTNVTVRMDRVKIHLKKCVAFIESVKIKLNETLPEHKKFAVAKVPLKQKKIDKLFIPDITSQEKVRFKELIAMYFYETATPFQRVENPSFAAAIKLLRSNASLPSRRELGGNLLNSCYSKVKEQVDISLGKKFNFLSMTSDAWTDTNSNSVLTYNVASTTREEFFIESVEAKKNRHTADYLAADFERVNASLKGDGEDKVVGFVTDNTKTNKSMWNILRPKYPTKYFYGCFAHGLHLIVKHLFDHKMDEKVLVINPFDELIQFMLDSKEMVKFFKNHHIVKSCLEDEQKVQKVKRLALPGETRWGSLLRMFQNNLASANALHKIVNERDFVTSVTTIEAREQRMKIKDFVCREDFDAVNEKAILLLTPIDVLIVKCQSSFLALSEIYHLFDILPIEYENLKNNGEITAGELKYIKALLKHYWEFMYSDCHGVAYLLDARYVGERLKFVDKNLVKKFITTMPIDGQNVCVRGDDRNRQLTKELDEFSVFALDHKQENTDFYTDTVASADPVTWWKINGGSWKLLQLIAVKVFSLSPSSALAERTFSGMSLVHAKLRNRLGVPKVQKLHFVRVNTLALNKKRKINDDSSDEQDEEVNLN
jgi:hypothetical protein